MTPTDLASGAAWTDDNNSENGWVVRNGSLIQMAANEDSEPFGDRYLLPNQEIALGSATGSTIEAASDMMLIDYRGGVFLWQGMGFFLNPSDPGASGKVFSILERADDDETIGLRVHCDGWCSPLVPFNVRTYHWYRMKVRIERVDESQGKVYAKVWESSSTEPSSWMIESLLPASAALDRSVFAVGTSAQFGFERNPRVAFGEVAVGSNTSVNTEGLQIPSRQSIVDEHLRSLVEYAKEYKRSSDGTAVHVYSEIIEQVDRLKNDYPEYPNLETAQFAKLRALGALGRLGEFDNLAASLENSSLASEEFSGGATQNEVSATHKASDINQALSDDNYTEAVNLIDQFIATYPNDARVPEMKRALCHSLFELPDQEERYWQETNDFIANKTVEDEVDDIIYNQAAWLEKHGRYEEARAKINVIRNEMPEAELPSSLLFLTDLNTYYLEKDYAKVEELGQQYRSTHSAGTPIGATARMYLGMTEARKDNGDLRKAAGFFDEILSADKTELDRGEIRGHLPSKALYWRAWIDERENNITGLRERMIKARDQLPDGPVRESMMSRYPESRLELLESLNR